MWYEQRDPSLKLLQQSPLYSKDSISLMYDIGEQHVELQEGSSRGWAPPTQGPFGIVEDGLDDGYQTCTTSR